jgi:hypothetical protein
MNEITSPIPVDKLIALKHMDVFLDAPVDKNGLAIIDRRTYESLCSLYADRGDVRVDRFMFRFGRVWGDGFRKKSNSIEEPYCDENEIQWEQYCDDPDFNRALILNILICRAERDETDSELEEIFRGRVIFKDTETGFYGEPTGYFLGMVTSPLILARSEDGDPLFLVRRNEKFSTILDYLFPRHCVILARNSLLGENERIILNTINAQPDP